MATLISSVGAISRSRLLFDRNPPQLTVGAISRSRLLFDRNPPQLTVGAISRSRPIPVDLPMATYSPAPHISVDLPIATGCAKHDSNMRFTSQEKVAIRRSLLQHRHWENRSRFGDVAIGRIGRDREKVAIGRSLLQGRC